MNREYGKNQDLDDMVREEKTSSAKDQLRMFERSIVVSSCSFESSWDIRRMSVLRSSF